MWHMKGLRFSYPPLNMVAGFVPLQLEWRQCSGSTTESFKKRIEKEMILFFKTKLWIRNAPKIFYPVQKRGRQSSERLSSNDCFFHVTKNGSKVH